MHPLRSLAAGEALAARLVLEEAHEVLGDVHHAGVLVHDDHAARTHDRPGLPQAVEVDGKIEALGRYATTRRAAGLHGLDFRPGGGAAADVVDHLAEGHPERHLDQSGVANLADQREDLGAGVTGHADLGVLGGAAIDDDPDIGEGLDVVDTGRAAVNASLDRVGGSLSRLPHESFHRPDQGSLLAAHEGARAANDLDLEVEPCAENVGPDETELAGLAEGDQRVLDRQRVLAANIDDAMSSADRDAGDQHPLEDRVRVALEEAAIHVGAGIALVTVADHVLGPVIVAAGPRELPLLPGRETGSSTAA